MISMIKAVRRIVGSYGNRLISPVALSVIDSLLNSGMYRRDAFCFC